MDSDSDSEYGYDYDSSEDPCDEEISASQGQSSAEHESVLSADFLQEMNEMIEGVSSMLSVPRSHARELLQYYKWEENEVYDKFYNADSDINELCKLASIAVPNMKEIVANKDVECGACMSDIPSVMVTIECGHMFCKGCILTHLYTGIEDRRPLLTCLDCECLLDDELIDSLIVDYKLKRAYRRRIVGSFVESRKNLQWCPASNCPNVVHDKSGYAAEVVCKCGQEFCFGCGNSVHQPISCKLLRLWMKKSEQESDTAKYLQAHTKNCPKCDTNIQKVGGMNRIQCRNEVCGHIFCWLCLDAYIDYHHTKKCAGHDEGSTNKTKTRKTLETYLVHHERWADHFNWLKNEAKLKETVQAKMEEIAESTEVDMGMAAARFLYEALVALVKTRMTLMNTCIFAFFTDMCPEKKLFLKNHTDLERATLELTGLLEGGLAGMRNMDTFHKDVLSKSRYCLSRSDALLKHVEDGNENEIWQYTTLEGEKAITDECGKIEALRK